MTASGFGTLIEEHPWNVVRRWRDAWCGRAVCEEGAG